MSVKYIQTGDAVDYTPVADVGAGDVVVQGDLVGVAKLDILTGKLGALALTGLFDFPKATGESTAIAAGARCYWDAAVWVATANASLDELRRYAQDKGVDYLVVDARELGLRPQFAPLVEGTTPPPWLELAAVQEEGDERIVIYRLTGGAGD